jgi:hypothetical protein
MKPRTLNKANEKLQKAKDDFAKFKDIPISELFFPSKKATKAKKPSFLQRVQIFLKKNRILSVWLFSLISTLLLTAMLIPLAIFVPPVGAFFAPLLFPLAKMLGLSTVVSSLSTTAISAIAVTLAGVISIVSTGALVGAAKLITLGFAVVKERKASADAMPKTKIEPKTKVKSKSKTKTKDVHDLDEPLIDLSTLKNKTLPFAPPPKIIRLVPEGQQPTLSNEAATLKSNAAELKAAAGSKQSSASASETLATLFAMPKKAGELLIGKKSHKATFEEKQAVAEDAVAVLNSLELGVEWVMISDQDSRKVGVKATTHQSTPGEQDGVARVDLKKQLNELGLKVKVKEVMLANDETAAFTITAYDQLRKIAALKPATPAPFVQSPKR